MGINGMIAAEIAVETTVEMTAILVFFNQRNVVRQFFR